VLSRSRLGGWKSSPEPVVDGYAGYRKLAERGDVKLAFCWAHMRRNFDELATPGPAPIASEALKHALSRWDGLTRLIDDGIIEIDNNAVERSIRPIALNRKNALFAGSVRC
jgi:transposase